MYSASFDYHRAKSLSDAQRLLASNPGAKLLAGGHSLIPLMKLRLATPSAVVDIGRIPELRGISRSGDGIRIGSLTTHAEIAASADVQKASAALAEAAAAVGDPAVRSRGTIGGNVAHADPASDLPTALVAVDRRGFSAAALGEQLRGLVPPVIARIEQDRVLLDLRTVLPEDDEPLARSLAMLSR
jgi:carbon-monoxide dehydrogenase medium subunit